MTMREYLPTGMKLQSYSLRSLITDNSRNNNRMVNPCVSRNEPSQHNNYV
ncbi:MAG: hypothetical protein BWX87_01679 [Bacteroidetes bacterium ADurb.Bin123]|nr:MAG: hypothetical protein BWX87_01679 [Bacteroidetes bacterium ADurb.Bin123]